MVLEEILIYPLLESIFVFVFFYQAMSGMEVDPDIVTLYNDMKLRKTKKWATFKISDEKKIVIDQLGDPKETETLEDDEECFGQLKATLTTEQPRYILYDFGFKGGENRTVKKLAFIFW